MATIRRFTQSELARSYLFDSSFLVTLIIESQRWNAEAGAFFQRLAGDVQGRDFFISPLAFAEFSKAVTRALLKDRLQMTSQQAEDEMRERGPGRVTAELKDALSRLNGALDYLPWSEVVLDVEQWYRAGDVMVKYAMQPYDAIHAASAYYARCADIVTFDYGFDRLDDMSVWRVQP